MGNIYAKLTNHYQFKYHLTFLVFFFLRKGEVNEITSGKNYLLL